MIKIYTGQNCSYCEAAKKLCDQRGVAYETADIADHMPADWIKKIGFVPRSVPQIFDGTDYIGGFTEFQTYIDTI
jgi:glutaredoxin